VSIEWIELVERRKKEAPIWRVRCPSCLAVYLRVRSNFRESPESCKACAAKKREAARRGHCQRIAALPRPGALGLVRGPKQRGPDGRFLASVAPSSEAGPLRGGPPARRAPCEAGPLRGGPLASGPLASGPLARRAPGERAPGLQLYGTVEELYLHGGSPSATGLRGCKERGPRSRTVLAGSYTYT
jgi:hypothetical protein